MTFAKPVAKEKDEKEHNPWCSVDGCKSLWAVRLDGDKQKCSYHQWVNDPPRKKRSFADLPTLKVKTVTQWYDDKISEDEF
jgi:hypothetical protein